MEQTESSVTEPSSDLSDTIHQTTNTNEPIDNDVKKTDQNTLTPSESTLGSEKSVSNPTVDESGLCPDVVSNPTVDESKRDTLKEVQQSSDKVSSSTEHTPERDIHRIIKIPPTVPYNYDDGFDSHNKSLNDGQTEKYLMTLQQELPAVTLPNSSDLINEIEERDRIISDQIIKNIYSYTQFLYESIANYLNSDLTVQLITKYGYFRMPTKGLQHTLPYPDVRLPIRGCTFDWKDLIMGLKDTNGNYSWGEFGNYCPPQYRPYLVVQSALSQQKWKIQTFDRPDALRVFVTFVHTDLNKDPIFQREESGWFKQGHDSSSYDSNDVSADSKYKIPRRNSLDRLSRRSRRSRRVKSHHPYDD